MIALRQARALRQAAQQPVLAHAVLQRAHGRRVRARVRAAHHKVRDVRICRVLRAPGSLIVLYTILCTCNLTSLRHQQSRQAEESVLIVCINALRCSLKP